MTEENEEKKLTKWGHIKEDFGKLKTPEGRKEAINNVRDFKVKPKKDHFTGQPLQEEARFGNIRLGRRR